MNIRELVIAGNAALADQRAADITPERAEALRVGSSGCVTDTDDVYGVCHRKALGRLLGLEEAPDLGTRIMWAAGERNEDTWVRVLTAAGQTLLSNVEIDAPVGSRMRRVVGHPDIVIAGPDGKPAHGLELKGIFGISTLALVLKGRAKNENLIQAAAYSMFLGIPFSLCYTNSNWARVGTQQVKPFHKIFFLEWDNKRLKYRAEDADKWTETVITQQGILDYFTLVDDMAHQQELGPRPAEGYVDGEASRGGPCDYCPFQGACSRYDSDRDYDRWIQTITQVTGGSNG